MVSLYTRDSCFHLATVMGIESIIITYEKNVYEYRNLEWIDTGR